MIEKPHSNSYFLCCPYLIHCLLPLFQFPSQGLRVKWRPRNLLSKSWPSALRKGLDLERVFAEATEPKWSHQGAPLTQGGWCLWQRTHGQKHGQREKDVKTQGGDSCPDAEDRGLGGLPAWWVSEGTALPAPPSGAFSPHTARDTCLLFPVMTVLTNECTHGCLRDLAYEYVCSPVSEFVYLSRALRISVALNNKSLYRTIASRFQE